MALFQATQVAAGLPVPNADRAAEDIPIVGDFVVPVGLALNDVIEMAPLPSGYVPVDVVFACEDTDSNGTPTMALDCGILSGTYGSTDAARTCGNEFFAASNVARTGGIERMNKAAGALLAPDTSATTARGVGVKVATAAATLVAGAKWRLTLIARPMVEGV